MKRFEAALRAKSSNPAITANLHPNQYLPFDRRCLILETAQIKFLLPFSQLALRLHSPRNYGINVRQRRKKSGDGQLQEE
jgi:hypothetical protein